MPLDNFSLSHGNAEKPLALALFLGEEWVLKEMNICMAEKPLGGRILGKGQNK
jgi:hypothetical protein